MKALIDDRDTKATRMGRCHNTLFRALTCELTQLTPVFRSVRMVLHIGRRGELSMDLIAQNGRARNDLTRAVRDAYIWNSLAQADIRSKYRLSTLGSLWITMSTGALAIGIGVLYGQFFGQDISQYLPYFAAGYILWIFISSIISEASTTMIESSGLIKGTSLPIVFHILRMIQRHFIIFWHNFLVVFFVWLYFRWPLSLSMLLSIFGLICCYLFMVGAAIIISIICVRYRDIPPLIAALTQFLFFASPVIWHPEQLKFGSVILYLNPVTYFLMTVRDPLLDRPLHFEAFAGSALLAVSSLAIGSLFYIRYRGRIAYWV